MFITYERSVPFTPLNSSIRFITLYFILDLSFIIQLMFNFIKRITLFNKIYKQLLLPVEIFIGLLTILLISNYSPV